jgi:hypothetical protein
MLPKTDPEALESSGEGPCSALGMIDVMSQCVSAAVEASGAISDIAPAIAWTATSAISHHHAVVVWSHSIIFY